MKAKLNIDRIGKPRARHHAEIKPGDVFHNIYARGGARFIVVLPSTRGAKRSVPVLRFTADGRFVSKGWRDRVELHEEQRVGRLLRGALRLTVPAGSTRGEIVAGNLKG